jgi:hypothetical protein
MTATTASDPSGVQYFFHCLTTGGHDSGWQASATYVDTRLSPNTKYTYQVMTRDNSPNQNQGSYSTPASATTPPVPGPLPNLTPYQPPGWSDKIVVTRQSGSHTDSSPFYTTDSLYVDFAVVNNGTASTETGFSTAMYIDGVLLASYGPSFSLAVGSYWNPGGISIGSLGAGPHSVGIVADSTGAIAESNETDNTYTKTITVTNNPPDTQVTTCAVSGQYLGLCWPTNASGFALESTPTLGPGCSWTSVPQTPIVVGDHYTVTDAVSGTCRFYRLRKP